MFDFPGAPATAIQALIKICGYLMLIGIGIIAAVSLKAGVDMFWKWVERKASVEEKAKGDQLFREFMEAHNGFLAQFLEAYKENGRILQEHTKVSQQVAAEYKNMTGQLQAYVTHLYRIERTVLKVKAALGAKEE